MFKKLLATLFTLGLASAAAASSDVNADYVVLYDLDATAITYCRITGLNGDPFQGPMVGRASISTSGSSATTTATTALSAPFRDIAVGDILIVKKSDNSTLMRVVIARADADTVTVNSAWDLTGGYEFTWKKLSCGTASTDGWINVGSHDNFSITLSIDQVNVTGGIDIQIQCRNGAMGGSVVQVFPACTTGSCNTVQNYSGTAGIASSTTVSFPSILYKECRVGMLIRTSDDGGDTGANRENLNISVTKSLSSR